MKKITFNLTALMVFTTIAAFAQPGTLDSTFNGDGKVTTKVKNHSVANSVVIQGDGKIVVAGYAYPGRPNVYYFALVRYRENGTIDRAFGINGKVTTDFFGTGSNNKAYSVAIQGDGKIVVAGSSNYNFALARYRYNGTLDSAFGENGKVINDFGSNEGWNSVVIQPDGKIVVAGSFVLARYKWNGKPDSTFGTNGRVIIDFGAYSVAVQKDGKILAVGSVSTDFALIRYRQNGKPDSTFGTNGRVITDFGNGSHDIAYSVIIQGDRKIVVAGLSHKPTATYIALARYKWNGKPDRTFGENGRVITYFIKPNGIAYGHSVAIQANGKIVVAGVVSQYTSDFALVRYNPDGDLDNTFGRGGKVFTDFGNYDYGNSVAIQEDGKIVVAGDLAPTIAVARYNGDSTLPANTGQDNFSNLQKQENNKSTGIYLSPNPAKDMLRIQSLSSSAKTISIIDMTGRTLQKTVTANAVYSCSVKQLEAGIYFIKIEDGKKITTLKFIKE